MILLPADYVLIAFVLGWAVLGLFRGFSGSVAFLAGVVIAGLFAVTGWRYSADYLSVAWQRGLATFVATLIVFGIVRFLIGRFVNKLLAQPADAIFGFLIGAAVGCLPMVVWALSGFCLEYSTLASEIAGYVG